MSNAAEICQSDEAALSWYFGRGLSIYERSTFAAVIRKLNAEAFGSEACDRCGGAGILDKGGFDTDRRCKTCDGKGRLGDGHTWCHDCGGFGSVEAYEKPADYGGWCPQCKGSGSTPVETAARRRTPCGVCGGRHNRDYRKCGHCIGTGEELITAKPIHKAQEAGGVTADDSALTRFAITSRRVARVREQSPALAAALAAYYGDVGQRWAQTDRGRLFALYHLTPSGKRLSRWGDKAATDLDVSTQERIGAQAALESTQPKRERAALLEAAARQSAELYARAATSWNTRSVSKRERRTWDRLLVSLAKLGHEDLAESLAISLSEAA